MLLILRTTALHSFVHLLFLARVALNGAASTVSCLLGFDIKGVKQGQDQRRPFSCITMTPVSRLGDFLKCPRELKVDISTIHTR